MSDQGRIQRLRKSNLTVLSLVLLILAGLGACVPAGQPLGETGSIATINGTVASIDTSEMAVDGPARIVLNSDQYGKVTVLVASCLGPCALDVVERLDSIQTGDRWQARGEVEGENTLVIYDEAEHSLEPLMEH